MASTSACEDFKNLGIDKHDDVNDTKRLEPRYSSSGERSGVQEGTVEELQGHRHQYGRAKQSWYGSGEEGFSVGAMNEHAVAETPGTEYGQQDGQDVETQFRRRGTSISFDPNAKADDGRQHSLEKPLPRVESRTRNGRSRTGTEDSQGSYFDSERVKINPFTGEPVRRRTRRSDGFPRLETVQSTDNPQGLQTPVLDSGEFGQSPGGISAQSFSPGGSDFWPQSRSMSLRRSRRESRMSSTTSSPAASFLMRYAPGGRESLPADPDDEGQSFGLNNEYVIGRQIGYGGFSVVKEVFSMDAEGAKRRNAVKIVRKAIRGQEERENEKVQGKLEHEVGIWRLLSHRHILPLHAVFETDFATFCVMDLVDSGSLYDLVLANRRSGSGLGSRSGSMSGSRSGSISNTTTKGIAKDLVKSYAFQLACALRYLHEDVRVVHRDVKLENCLIDRPVAQTVSAEAGVLKLCDFGLADWISVPTPEITASDQPTTDKTQQAELGEHEGMLGSLAYASPETLTAKSPLLDPAVDVWAFGPRIVEMILNEEWDEKAVRAAFTSDEKEVDQVLDVLRGCLQKDRNARWNIGQVLGSEWFGSMGDPYEGS
ncbi:hypothetical protein MBLNU457_3888t1 [Dothideomycetes sp. NU457]